MYRLIFLMVIEDRGLVFPKDDGEATKSRSAIESFTMPSTLSTACAGLPNSALPSTEDATTSGSGFSKRSALFETRGESIRLGLRPLAGELFGPDALELLRETSLSNDAILVRIERLVRFRNERKEWVRVRYSRLNVEEFGSVYEGLLELEPVVEEGESADRGAGWDFRFVKGTSEAGRARITHRTNWYARLSSMLWIR